MTAPGARILAVDDDPHIVRLIQVSLERAGFHVRTALDGVEAMECIEAELPDLVICDVMMPRMSGFEVLRRLKSEPSTAAIPVVMLTARTGDTDVSDAWECGADLYLSKPFDPSELVAFITRMLLPRDKPASP